MEGFILLSLILVCVAFGAGYLGFMLGIEYEQTRRNKIRTRLTRRSNNNAYL